MTTLPTRKVTFEQRTELVRLALEAISSGSKPGRFKRPFTVADNAFIAAADPTTILSLLNERDELHANNVRLEAENRDLRADIRDLRMDCQNLKVVK